MALTVSITCWRTSDTDDNGRLLRWATHSKKSGPICSRGSGFVEDVTVTWVGATPPLELGGG